MSVLSIVIPAYNESKTIGQLMQKVLDFELPKDFQKEIICINDCSTDNTLEILTDLAKKHPEIIVLDNSENMGKSQTVKKGLLQTKGDWVIIQDADLEYEPDDITFLLEQSVKNNCDVAYGNRFGKDNGILYVQNFFGNIFLSFLSSLFTSWRIHVMIPDMEVCYKLINGKIARELAKTISSKSNFGFEPEITAKLSRYKKENGEKLKFIILPISYHPRTHEQGKKMKAVEDGLKALWEILKFNLE